MVRYNDTMNMTDVFTPPAGTQMAYCIGTTFTVDMPSLIQSAFATQHLTSYESSSVDLLPKDAANNILFGKLENFSNKSVLFFHSNHISKVPELIFDTKSTGTRSRLLSLLDRVLVSVSAPKDDNKYGAFHPKVWLLRFDDRETKKPKIWRFLVGSRNLTGASIDDNQRGFWEIAACISGQVSKNPSKMNKNIKSFFEYLQKNCRESHHKSILKSAIQDLNKIEFQMPTGFDDMDFLWSNKTQDKFEILNRKNKESVIAISPFLSKSCVDELTKFKDRTLITSEKDLKYLNEHELGKNVYIYKDGKNENGALSLHAKLYILSNKFGSDVYLGSANMTRSGLYGLNVEAMLRLHSKQNIGNKFKSDFIKPSDKMGILHEVTPDSNYSDAESDLAPTETEKFRRYLESGCFVLNKVSAGQGWYLKWEHLDNAIPDIKSNISVQIQFAGTKPIDFTKVIKGKIKLSHFTSAFYKIKISVPKEKSEIFYGVALIESGARSARANELYASLVKEAPSIMSLLSELFQSDSTIRIVDISEASQESDEGKRNHHKIVNADFIRQKRLTRGVLELLLTADLTDPYKRETVDRLLERGVKEGRPDAKDILKLWRQITLVYNKVHADAS